MLRKANYTALKDRLLKKNLSIYYKSIYVIHISKNIKCHGAKLNFSEKPFGLGSLGYWQLH